MEFNKDAFARALKVKRAVKGWTQQDLANASGVSVDTIASYESGRTKPYFDTVVVLADALSCSVDEFVTIKTA